MDYDLLLNSVLITKLCCVLKTEGQRHPVLRSVSNRLRRVYGGYFTVGPDTRVEFRTGSFLDESSSRPRTVSGQGTPNIFVSVTRQTNKLTKRKTVGLW